MARARKVPLTIALATVLTPLAFLAAACSRPADQQFLTQFFRAARARDNTTLAMMSAVPFDPREKGSVEDFTITKEGDEQRTKLDFKTLITAQRKATEDDAEFRKKKIEYQNANLPELEKIVALERDPKAKMTPAQQKMKAEWDKWREDTSLHQKSLSATKAAIVNSTGPAEASLTQPGQPPFNPEKFDGELISKDVTVDANIKMPNGEMTKKTLVLTLQRVVGAQDGQQREGRWVITKITGA